MGGQSERKRWEDKECKQITAKNLHVKEVNIGRHIGRVVWSLGIQRCGRRFESQWQWVRSAIINETVSRSLLITPLWFPRDNPVSSNSKKAAKVNFEMGNIMCGMSVCTFLITL